MDNPFKHPMLAPFPEMRREFEEELGLEPGALLLGLASPSCESESETQDLADSGPTAITGVLEGVNPKETHSDSSGERASVFETPSESTVAAIVGECPERTLVIELLGCLAVHTRLGVDLLATAVGESTRKVERTLAGFEELLEYHERGETVSIETNHEHAVLRWMLEETTRRNAVVDTIARTEKLRSEGLHAVAANLIEAYRLGRERDDSEYCTAVIEFANGVLKHALEAGLSMKGWFTAAESIDLFARHGFPIEPTLLTDHIEDLIDGYQILADEYPELTGYTSSSFGDSKRIAGNNFGQLLAAAYGNPYVAYEDRENPVPLLNDIALAGGYCRQDPPVIEFRMDVFGEAVTALTTAYPERCTVDLVHELEAEMLDGIRDSSTDIEHAMLTETPVSALSPAMRRAEVRTRLWIAAASKLVNTHTDEPETQAHWLRFALDRAVIAVTESAGSDGDIDDVTLDSLLQSLYVETARALPAQSRSITAWKRGIWALDTALYGTVDQYCPTVAADEVRDRAHDEIRDCAFDEVTVESVECHYAFEQMIREGLVD